VALFVVTGGAGFIGSHLCAALVQRGDRVRVVDDLSSGRVENLAALGVGPAGSLEPVELLRADVLDEEQLLAAMRGAHGVFHEAAQVSVPASVRDPSRSFAINVTGTLRVLEAARAAGVPKVVFAASSAAYGDDPELPKVETQSPRPMSPYAAGKLAGEAMLAAWARSYGLSTVSLRYFNVYGERQADDSPYSGVIALFARAVLAGRAPTIFGTGEQTRDFVYVQDVVRANLLAMDRALEPGVVINVGTGRRVSIRRLFSILAERGAFQGQPVLAPERAGDVPHSVAAIGRARELLGFEPEWELERGLTRTLEWYRSR
jgi:UDP-glucose 4-epimerase